jgi:hypothetical protein
MIAWVVYGGQKEICDCILHGVADREKGKCKLIDKVKLKQNKQNNQRTFSSLIPPLLPLQNDPKNRYK